MPTYHYRAVRTDGIIQIGTLDAESRPEVLERVRHLGLTPIEASETQTPADTSKATKLSRNNRKAITRAISELAVLLEAGLTLDRALSICTDTISHRATRETFVELQSQVKQGVALSQAMLANSHLFSPMAAAMVEAGETNGQLDKALKRLAQTMERADEVRHIIQSSLTYPIILLMIATAVILMMLLFVVPQFETLFNSAQGKLPPATQAIMAASHGLKKYGIGAFFCLLALIFIMRHWLKQPSVKLSVDRLLLNLPHIGALISSSEISRFARALGSLVEGGVALPTAMQIAQRTFTNQHLAAAIARVTIGVREGSGLSGPLAATGLLPKIALGFFRTGEETAQLGSMLERLADVLDRDVRNTMEQMIAVLTPLITVALGGMVAFVIASIMSAIIGFNDIALAP
jgi:general secretion pathway protein F